MTSFDTIPEAFDWWIKNHYPALSPELKKGKAVRAWKDYTYNQGISEKRMREILIEFGHFKIKTSIVHEP
ncbi:hypothetical protein [Dyadobacter arcticus]|uniref:Uncharacterized protein n=1 Tax=Dyadobacter arcticus TaxID=1078754 RepID=A0ABX0UQV0_9BACT|nr:hypothetical protein [Dyadobacter arcticus]NIJ55373.1 hypothetical protein [Dyadobacter arcticus]